MKPLPIPKSQGGRSSIGTVSSLPGALAPPSGRYSTANRRAASSQVQRAYPWLLSISTALAAVFCLLYITKPVILKAPPSTQPSAPSSKPALASTPSTSSGPSSLMPGGDHLPGEGNTATQKTKSIPANPRRALVAPPSSAFEETNLRIQHILTAEAPGGHLDRIDIDVPVLYQSRNLRWTSREVEDARTLLAHLMDYQEKTRTLRSEGVELLDAWNRLVQKSIPATDLRADSPSLPENQGDAADKPSPAGLITTESIQIQPQGK